MTENQLCSIVIEKCFKIHRALGPGLLESVYEEILVYELEKENIKVERQVGIGVDWEGKKIPLAFRADLIVEKKLIVELKSVKSLDDVFKKKLHTYIRLAGIKLGLLVNFNEVYLKDGIKRIANGL
jgi:GxxExxY protein